MKNLKTSRFITIKELEELGKRIPYSLLQCVDCGRWIDMNKKAISDWKLEIEMDKDELKVVSETKKAIENGYGSGWSTCKYCRMAYASKSSNLNWYKVAKASKNEDKIPLTAKERQEVKTKFGDNLECSFARDKDGYYCYTHRARSDSYPSIDKIPKSKVDFIGSTG